MGRLLFRHESETEDLYRATAEAVSKSITQASAQKGQIVFGVCGGRSARGVFKYLKEAEVPWERIHVFMVDERILPLGSPEQNFTLVKESFLAPLIHSSKLPAENVHPFIPRANHKDFGVKEYTEELEGFGGKYDVVFLSAGEDGHIASLFPNSSILNDSSGHILVLDSPKPPPRRMSASRRLLLKTSFGVLILRGEEKRRAYEKLMDPKTSMAECPAVLVKSLPTAYILTDIAPEEEPDRVA